MNKNDVDDSLLVARLRDAVRRTLSRLENEPLDSVMDRALVLWWDANTVASYSYQGWEQRRIFRWFEKDCDDGWPLVYLALSDLVQEFGSKAAAEGLHHGFFHDSKALARFLTRLGVRQPNDMRKPT